MDAFRKIALFGLGLADLTEAKAKELARSILERGEARAESVESLAKELREGAGKLRAALDARIEKAVAAAMAKGGLARAKDLDALAARVAAVEKKSG